MEYSVKVRYIDFETEGNFGPFSSSDLAEQCALSLASRQGVLSAVIEVHCKSAKVAP